jgi:hypothetical protein
VSNLRERIARELARQYWATRGETITKEQEDEFWLSWLTNAVRILALVNETGLRDLLQEWMYEMGGLQQHDYDALCKKTEKALATPTEKAPQKEAEQAWKGPWGCEHGHAFEPPFDAEAVKYLSAFEPLCCFDGKPLHHIERRKAQPITPDTLSKLVKAAEPFAEIPFEETYQGRTHPEGTIYGINAKSFTGTDILALRTAIASAKESASEKTEVPPQSPAPPQGGGA